MAPNEARKLVGVVVVLHTKAGDLTGVVLSCTIESVWLIDAEETDVIVPLRDVRGIERVAA